MKNHEGSKEGQYSCGISLHDFNVLFQANTINNKTSTCIRIYEDRSLYVLFHCKVEGTKSSTLNLAPISAY
jgi:hypothetical protein